MSAESEFCVRWLFGRFIICIAMEALFKFGLLDTIYIGVSYHKYHTATLTTHCFPWSVGGLSEHKWSTIARPENLFTGFGCFAINYSIFISTKTVAKKLQNGVPQSTKNMMNVAIVGIRCMECSPSCSERCSRLLFAEPSDHWIFLIITAIILIEFVCSIPMEQFLFHTWFALVYVCYLNRTRRKLQDETNKIHYQP